MRQAHARPAAGLVIVAATVGILLAGCSPAVEPVSATAPVGHGEMLFLGTWEGSVDGSGEGVLLMIVSAAAADGTTFAGDLTYAADGTETTATVQAAMTPHGHLVASVGDTASIEAHITDPMTLDYCFVRYGFDPVYSCGRLTRQP